MQRHGKDVLDNYLDPQIRLTNACLFGLRQQSILYASKG